MKYLCVWYEWYGYLPIGLCHKLALSTAFKVLVFSYRDRHANRITEAFLFEFSVDFTYFSNHF